MTPAILQTTARRGASGTVTITNSTGRKLRMAVRARPWRQARNGDVAANRSRSLGGVSVSSTRFTLANGAQRAVSVTLNRVPSRGSRYGALDVVGKPTKRRRGINVAYNLISSLRFNPHSEQAPTAPERRQGEGQGSRLEAGALPPGPQPRQHRRSGRRQRRCERRGRRPEPAIASKAILPGKRIELRLMGLSGMRRGSYRASVTLSQAGRNMVSVTRSFRIR